MNLANKLTIFRMILVPVIVIIPFLNIEGSFFFFFITYLIIDLIFIIASITDKLDGYIARSRNQITTFGKFLDPIADKILVLSAMMLLVEFGKLPAWIPIIVVTRVIAANFWGKLKTVTQMVAIVLAFIDINKFGAIFNGRLEGTEFVINMLVTILMSVSVVATIFSGWEYIKDGKDLFKE